MLHVAMAPKQGPQRKNWRFTIFQGDLSVHDSLDLWEQAIRNVVPNGVNYLVFQQELAPTTGTEHIQGFVALSQRKRSVQVGQLFQVQHTCFDGCDGTPSDNRGYCTDDDKRAPAKQPFEYGTLPGGQGKRTDLDRAIDLVKSGHGVKRLIDDAGSSYLRYHGGFDKLASHYKSQRVAKAETLTVSLYVVWGTPGSGKTTWAHEFDPGNSYEMPDPVRGGTVWMPDYDGQRTLIIEDYDGEYPYGTLKRMCDGTFTKFQTKGGHNYAEWDMIVITSNFHPRYWYPKQREDVWIYDVEQGYPGPLQRRINNVCQFEGIWPDVTCTIDSDPCEGWPPTRAELTGVKPTAEAPVRHPSPLPSASPDLDSYRAHSTGGHSPPTPPTPVVAPSSIDSAIVDLMGELPVLSTPPTAHDLDVMGANFLDDTDFHGVLVQPAPQHTGIPPAWIDNEAGEGTEPTGSIVW